VHTVDVHLTAQVFSDSSVNIQKPVLFRQKLSGDLQDLNACNTKIPRGSQRCPIIPLWSDSLREQQPARGAICHRVHRRTPDKDEDHDRAAVLCVSLLESLTVSIFEIQTLMFPLYSDLKFD
jgi:hypothetical protein